MKTENLLTIREQEVLQLIAKAQPRKRIADHLRISIRTVDTHISNIHRKYNTHSTLQLALMAAQSNAASLIV